MAEDCAERDRQRQTDAEESTGDADLASRTRDRDRRGIAEQDDGQGELCKHPQRLSAHRDVEDIESPVTEHRTDDEQDERPCDRGTVEHGRAERVEHHDCSDDDQAGHAAPPSGSFDARGATTRLQGPYRRGCVRAGIAGIAALWAPSSTDGGCSTRERSCGRGLLPVTGEGARSAAGSPPVA